MKKAIYMIAFFVLSLLFVSAHTDTVMVAERGFKAPPLKLDSEKGSISLSQLKGKYVLVNFWTSVDATSRIVTADFDRLLGQSDKVSLLSVNLDADECLFREIVHNDSLNDNTQYHADASAAITIYADYLPGGRMCSYLIDPQGFIVAINPSLQFISSL